MPLLDVADTEGAVRTLLEGIARKRGYVPAPVQVMAHSPATASGYTALATALASGVLDVKIRERIAIAVAGANDCPPCLIAHTGMAQSAGVSDEDIASARQFASADPKAAAALALARAAMSARGHVSDADFEAAAKAGLSDAEKVEVIANVVVNIMTNWMNALAKVEPNV
jgi:AhpD family alkylhydroperoxidase